MPQIRAARSILPQVPDHSLEPDRDFWSMSSLGPALGGPQGEAVLTTCLHQPGHPPSPSLSPVTALGGRYCTHFVHRKTKAWSGCAIQPVTPLVADLELQPARSDARSCAPNHFICRNRCLFTAQPSQTTRHVRRTRRWGVHLPGRKEAAALPWHSM